MRGNPHFVVPAAKFRLDPGAGEFITTYTFGTQTAKHTFCKVCGITSFYTPRSSPGGVAVTVTCVDPGTIEFGRLTCKSKWRELIFFDYGSNGKSQPMSGRECSSHSL
jgi:hypothetical protein